VMDVGAEQVKTLCETRPLVQTRFGLSKLKIQCLAQ